MSKLRETRGQKIIGALEKNAVPILFGIICLIGIPFSGYSLGYLGQEIIVRISRNSFLIIALLVPIMAGMGLNFGMTLGAMAGQIGLIFMVDWGIVGIPGMILAMIISTPISAFLGWMCGKILNMAKGREMVTSYIIGFFINGVYQLIVLYGMGSVIPIKNTSLVLPRGYGIRNTVNLITIRKALDNLLAIRFLGISIPFATLLIIALLCIFIVWFRRTKLGQDMRAVGQDMEVARAAGIRVEHTRIVSVVISTILAGYGMILYLQNMGTLNTYNSHMQIGMFSIAALLVGGASVARASIGNVFLGVSLFHLMFVVSPPAGKRIIGDAQLGEYFRVFVSYGVITIALVLYEIRKRRKAARGGLLLAQDQVDSGEVDA
ncbi:MAG: ABC transporter permease [Sphaerochaetaceae bacterium]|jgi:simple sugar transport system permease protein|nr:ABC transporter permease [Sphaerochaetaceae bacterium]NLO59725.1 ABC transporter permease [Spirochaetales bacterium]MDD2405226.1 ABC transporter permease [Sphaerochaetaceae bacterium]MDD3669715.1 ABC transporter permease [Sphaerochaetaceae bacterium]MDD4258802.1 ABC transporter permease [Sphaerochaetaceae bacterium]